MKTMPIQPEKISDKDFLILGLKPEASQVEVKRAYRSLVRRLHPDRFQQRSSLERREAEEKLKEVTGAYRRISRGWASGGLSANSPKVKKETFDAERTPGEKAKPKPAPAGSLAIGIAALKKWLVILRNRFDPQLLPQRYRPLVGLLLLLVVLFAIVVLPRMDPSVSRPAKPASERDAAPSPSSSRLESEDLPLAPLPSPDEYDAMETGPLPRSSSERASPFPLDASADTFTLGSVQEDVLRIQGPPTEIRGQTWVYGLSDVYFKDGRVWRYNNFDGSLKVSVLPSNAPVDPPPQFFTLGSTVDEVLTVQGTPTRIEGNRWYYGFSEILFRDGRVSSFDNFFGNLRIQILPSDPSILPNTGGTFTVGSTRDEVLAIEGTPMSIQGNFWFYRSSSILFRDGRVEHVSNSGGDLHFVPARSAQ